VHILNETKLLLEKTAFLESQLSQAEKREDWGKGQVEKAQETIQQLEYKQPQKKDFWSCTKKPLTIVSDNPYPISIKTLM
jgi:hypothetical protein